MFRIIKRSPWIALGAAGAWFFDPAQGSQRRAMVTSKAREWKDELMARPPTVTTTTPETPLGSTPDTPDTRLAGEFAQRSA